jgi:hypothetical protein
MTISHREAFDALGTLSLDWRGNFMPQTGERVRVTMNGLGTGVVFGYFMEEGFMGVKVELDEPPAWFTKQNGHHIAHVFGTEIAQLEAAQ